MSSQSASPTSASTIANSGTVDWTSPANIEAQDGSFFASCSLSNATTFLLSGAGYSFSIPAGATVTGIGVGIWRRDGGGFSAINSTTISLSVNGVSGTPKTDTTAWPSSNTQASYGGDGDLWGLSPSPADINASVAAGVQCHATFSGASPQVDYIGVTVFYTVPTVTPRSIVAVTRYRRPWPARPAVLIRPPFPATISTTPLPKSTPLVGLRYPLLRAIVPARAVICRPPNPPTIGSFTPLCRPYVVRLPAWFYLPDW